jgi:hypothetical protein
VEIILPDAVVSEIVRRVRDSVTADRPPGRSVASMRSPARVKQVDLEFEDAAGVVIPCRRGASVVAPLIVVRKVALRRDDPHRLIIVDVSRAVTSGTPRDTNAASS